MTLRSTCFRTDAPFGVTGAAASGARLFFIFYFIGTGLHGVHMLVGVGLVLWIVRRARRGDFSAPTVPRSKWWVCTGVSWMSYG